MTLKSVLTFASGIVLGFGTLRLMLDWNISTPNFYQLRNSSSKERSLHRLDKGDEMVVDSTNSRPRVLCWIMTGQKNLNSRTRHVKETWAKRCDVTLYMSSQESPFPTVGLNVSEGRENLYWKTIRAFQYIHEKHLDDADWFLKADDDTFVVVENLRFTVSALNPEEPWYLGRRFAPFIKQGYMSGGAGYVLSKEAVRRFVRGFETGKCTHFSILEDMALGKCMESMNVQAADTRDVLGRQTFHAYPLEKYVLRVPQRVRPWDLAAALITL
ncbi:glycoprotein-N-acetylgalactosamine 3-beta-galactosyltransferase 1 isoform X2 [Boleophthalmus pectinirostris]|uniref:glycoprotein-N-acetylgalactosamine 3-beta-galactosyltransferase 1 isoform X2 n=1 Tax=Boleophthalmus pectinirostris TaxID=150288 RepID=UPI000A1C632A|nr:glycoprotein-N-acetylgalactosamine 3-beta-galactosyltransferase 1 isoform X2 [Boleophthalmus pectinirostris]